MNLMTLDIDFVTAGRLLLVPLVDVRLLVVTPTAWLPALAAGLLLTWAWWQDRTDRMGGPEPRGTDALAGLVGLVIFAWFFQAGQFPWNEGDWKEEWTFFVAWQQALHLGSVPYYLVTAMQGTERYLANLQTPLMPYVFALRFVSIPVFVLFHMTVVYGVGFVGVVALRRELELRLLPWAIFLLLFILNGHIVSHLSVGHLPWVAYFLVPWVLVSAVRTSRGDQSFTNVATCAATFAAMILIGGWHVFVWSLLFMAFTCLVAPRGLVVLTQVGLITVLLAAARLAPAMVTFGVGSNIFMSGYPTGISLLSALVAGPTSTALLDQWETNAFVGWFGFLLLCVGAVPFRQPGQRFMNRLLVPTVALSVLSLGRVYGETLFRLPGFVSERVTTRMIILPILWLALAGAVRFDAWWRRQRVSLGVSVVVLLGAWFLVLQLVLHLNAWRPHVLAAIDGLPVDVLKAIPVETLYGAAFWCGVVVSVASAVAVARLILRGNAQARSSHTLAS